MRTVTLVLITLTFSTTIFAPIFAKAEGGIEALGDHRPARSALAVNGLALGGSVEIECIAAR